MAKIEQIRQLLNQGLYLYPLKPNGKRPITKHGYLDASNDINQWQEWLGKYGEHVNIGINLKLSHLIALDIDMHGDSGWKAMFDLGDNLSIEHASVQTYSEDTAGAGNGLTGRHLFYKHQLTSKQRKFDGKLYGYDGLEVLTDSAIIAPSSIAGNEYEPTDTTLTFKDALDAPEWLINILIGNIKPNTKTDKPIPPKPTKSLTTSQFQASLEQGVTTGGRNNWLASKAGWLLTHGTSTDDLQDELIEINKKYIQPPLPADEVMTVANSIIKTRARSERMNKPVINIDPELKEQISSSNKVVRLNPWYITDDNGKANISEPALAKAIMDEQPFLIAGNATQGYAYDKKTGTWRVGMDNLVKDLIQQKMDSVAYWSASKFNGTQQIINNRAINNELSQPFDFDKDDKRINLIAFNNGTYNLATDTIEPHNPDNYLLASHGYNLDMHGTYDNTFKWLVESTDDNTAIFLMQYIGYCFYHSYTPFQEFVILHGKGGDGKSTFLNHVSKMLCGSNVSGVSLKSLTSNDGSGRFAPASLYHKELNIDTDISDNFMKDSSMLKRLTGADTISAEFKGQNGFEFMNYAKLFFSANTLPAFKDSSLGFARRINIVEFNKIDDFTSKYNMQTIIDEIPAFTYQCIREFKKALDAKELMHSNSMITAKDKWINDNDTIQRFIDDCFNFSVASGHVEPLQHVYNEYNWYCRNNGYKALGRNKLKAELESKGYVPKASYDKTTGKTKRGYTTFKIEIE